MTAHFIDVGQAHATLLEFPCGAMLVDAGSDENHANALVSYLETFFTRRTDLNRTLDVVLITHNHLDHTRNLRAVVEAFTVKRYFDNGFTEGSGVGGPNWVKREVAEGRRDIEIRVITQAMVRAASGDLGLSDQDIDPFSCGTVDPRVHILAGRQDSNPGWPEGDFENQNNHSLVTRIDFDEASFLFVGDLQEAGIESLLDDYEEGDGLNTDVLQVGHHGSHNATTPALLAEVTPSVAVIPVGPWTFGQGSQAPYTLCLWASPLEYRGAAGQRDDSPPGAIEERHAGGTLTAVPPVHGQESDLCHRLGRVGSCCRDSGRRPDRLPGTLAS